MAKGTKLAIWAAIRQRRSCGRKMTIDSILSGDVTKECGMRCVSANEETVLVFKATGDIA